MKGLEKASTCQSAILTDMHLYICLPLAPAWLSPSQVTFCCLATPLAAFFSSTAVSARAFSSGASSSSSFRSSFTGAAIVSVAASPAQTDVILKRLHGSLQAVVLLTCPQHHDCPSVGGVIMSTPSNAMLTRNVDVTCRCSSCFAKSKQNLLHQCEYMVTALYDS